jgi:hypothetical protein
MPDRMPDSDIQEIIDNLNKTEGDGPDDIDTDIDLD